MYPVTSTGSAPSRGASSLARALRRGAEPLLAPAAGALAIGLQVLALGHAWRRLHLPVIERLQAPLVPRVPARAPRASERAADAGATNGNGHTGNGHSGQNVTFNHELRRRLAALRVLSEAIEVRNGSEDDLDRLVHLLVCELHDLEELEAAMLGTGKRDTRDEVDVLEVARAAAQTVGLARRSEILVQCSKRPLRLLTSPTMLRQALENLMDNAATCGAGRPVEVVVRFSMARRQPGVEVLVADRGPGLGKAAASRRAGQGVGLPLVRKFAQESKGRLWCHDRDGGGAVFGLWLPVAAMAAMDFAGPATTNGHGPNGHGRNGNGARRA